MQNPLPTSPIDVALFRSAAALLALSGLVMAVRCTAVVAGDASLHLVLMEAGAQGHWFEFNPGIAEPLTSSLLWTGLGTALWWIGGVTSAVVGLKAIGLAAWVAVAALAGLLARRLGAGPASVLLAALFSSALPGTVENSLCGMENGLFAALVLGLALLAVAPLTSADLGWARALALGADAALVLLARPEGTLPVAGLAVALSVVAWTRTSRGLAFAKVALVCVVAVVLAFPAFHAYSQATHQWLPQSAVSRAMRARRDPFALSLAGFWLHARPWLRLLAYAPLCVLAWVGLRRGPVATASRLLFGWALAGALLYGVVGAVHTARYVIWIFALLGPLAAVGVERLRLTWLRAPLLVWIGLLACGECVMRLATQSFRPTVAQVIRSVEDRRSRTTELLAAICAHGCCGTAGQPVDLAAIEIQSRFTLDSRVRVFSVEGLTLGPSGTPPDFAVNGCPDLSSLVGDPGLLAWLDDPREALEGCALTPALAAVEAAWRGEPSQGWTYDPIGSVVRDCR